VRSIIKTQRPSLNLALTNSANCTVINSAIASTSQLGKGVSCFYQGRSSKTLPLPSLGASAPPLPLRSAFLQRRTDCQMRTLTAYGIAVVMVFAILNGIFWLLRNPRLHDLNIFSAGFVLGMLGMYTAAWLYGYRQF
jgi:hypothetical protein